MSQAKNGDTVKIHYKGQTKEGNVFASSQEEEPLEFVIGGGILLPGVEKAIEGMEAGEQKTVVLAAEEGFGQRHEDMILFVERTQFPDDFDAQVGMEFQIPQEDGSYAFFKILDVEGDKVKLDGNHPLAGQELTFDLELLEIG